MDEKSLLQLKKDMEVVRASVQKSLQSMNNEKGKNLGDKIENLFGKVQAKIDKVVEKTKNYSQRKL